MGPTGNMTPQQVEQELMRVDNNIRPNSIILMTVLNALYPINVNIINKVASSLGKVLRIVVFKRGAIVQTMVEFEDVQTATTAKAQLHGCDIYSGCCTLKIEYAKPTKLNVYKNDADSWDYTNPNLGSGKGRESADRPADSAAISQRPVLLKEPIRHNGAAQPVQSAQIPSSVVTTQALVNGALQSMVDTHGFMAAAAAQGAAHQGRNSIGFVFFKKEAKAS